MYIQVVWTAVANTIMEIPGPPRVTPARCVSAQRELLPVKPTRPACSGVHMELFRRANVAQTVEVRISTTNNVQTQ